MKTDLYLQNIHLPLEMDLRLEILPPSPKFKSFINYYKYIEGFSQGMFKIVPSINQELYFHLNAGNYIFFSPGLYQIKHPLIHLIGLHGYQQDVFSYIPRNEMIKGFAVVFKPNGIQKLFRLSHSEINHHAIEGENLFRDHTEELWYKIKTGSGIYEMKERLEAFLGRYLTDKDISEPPFTNILNSIIMKQGILCLRQLCSEFHISQRTLQRKFLDEIGMSPKEYLQILRLNHALMLLKSNQYRHLTELSYLSGYYDQSHYIRDIRKIFGISPGGLKRNEDNLLNCDNRIFMDVPIR